MTRERQAASQQQPSQFVSEDISMNAEHAAQQSKGRNPGWKLNVHHKHQSKELDGLAPD